ncbi:type VII toxin-antitoxin system MntA family adenylyltransferase antitoxin [Candidatus Desulforudis audaxviator]|uniref:DNA polymerase, beta domain protein region n=1 Tax=Desulforudis audaxviator (strain MP104C) TaxID=477974 RepID=B1I1Z0_DESAP|nr:nucleotidyltransferase domain-containing protein [Candidatus Desulforudis audaxviator]ACA58922.1 DNA polymerase, beta domain protein region [Candidatus Desulforudis audaxviator MP104C]AZK58943.1 DNA polymerase, beta-like region [Candidatus Desulforudis audaxviator]
MSVFTEDQRQKIVAFCQNQPAVTAAYLFGSQVKGNAGPLSDIDLAFLVEPTLISQRTYPYGYRAFLLTELISILKSTEIDLIILNEVPPLLQFQVIYHGEVLFSRSDKKRLAFHVKAFNEYQDMRPLLAVQHKYMVERLNRRFTREAE